MNGRLFKIQDWEKLARQAKFQPGVMAALCPVSLRQLQRFFAEVFDQTPREWARKLRCRMARQLVSEGWSNRAVAEELGFGNESHLCHEFKRFYNVPPQAFAPLYDANHSAGIAFPKTPALKLPAALHQSPVAASVDDSQGTRSHALFKHVAFRQECRV
jgi:AraC-like DNA-binding protein